MSCTELSSQWLFVMLRMPIPRLQWPGSLLTWASPLSLPSHVTLIRRCQLFIIGLAFWSVWLQSSMMTCIMQSPHWSCNEYNDMCVLLRPVTTFQFQVLTQKICLLCLKACYAALLMHTALKTVQLLTMDARIIRREFIFIPVWIC